MKKSQNFTNTEVNKGFFQLEQGDVLWTIFGERDSKDTRTKIGNRPCVVISNSLMHKNFGLAIVVPITRQNHHPKANVEITSIEDLEGYAEPYQVKTLDLRKRGYNYIGKVSNYELGEILGKYRALTQPVK